MICQLLNKRTEILLAIATSCYVSIALIFIKVGLKISYFYQKIQIFRALGALPPNPRNPPLPLQISGYAPGN